MPALWWLVGCETPEVVPRLARAELEVSTRRLDFDAPSDEDPVKAEFTLHNPGQVRLGVRDIGLASGDGAFGWTVGAPSEGTPIPGDERDLSTTETGFALVLEPGSDVTVTVTFFPTLLDDNYDALVFTTEDEPDDSFPPQSRIYGDADTAVTQVWLHGPGAASPANLLISPRANPFGFVAPGDSATQFVALRNTGERPLKLLGVKLVEADPGFSVTYKPEYGSILEPGTSSVVEVAFSGSYDLETARLQVSSDDPDDPVLSVSLEANTPDKANNILPTVGIISPEAGFQLSGHDDITVVMAIHDDDQRADMLKCTIRSAVQLGGTLQTCVADKDGRATVDVQTGRLEPGVDTWTVTVIDGSGGVGVAAVPILLNVGFPLDDGDRDGYSESSDPPDCDDDAIGRYPGATERIDGLDDNCDEVVDDGTTECDDDLDHLTEADGDCDDSDEDTYPGAPEPADGDDNDCDGIVDEGTAGTDDDGDGYAETDRDCDDADPSVSPAADELCANGADDDCNGTVDVELCASTAEAPRVIGRIAASATTVEVGGEVVLEVLVYDPDRDAPIVDWSADAGSLAPTSGTSVTWNAPATPGTSRISVVVRDDDGHEDKASLRLTTVAAGTLDIGIIRE